MKFLHSWLQEYIEDEIPKGEEFVKVISQNSFEVESSYAIASADKGSEEDFIYDLNILPNRAHDALSHYFMAKEIATIFNLKLKNTISDLQEFKKSLNIIQTDEDFIKIADPKACSRFMGVRVNGVEVKESPDFIKYRLEAIGQKSINNIVDITNYVQFSYNKPMHAYDSELVSIYLEARFIRGEEKMTTLDNKELNLDENTLVIADQAKVLGLAGIKGGRDSGISENTKKVIIESANFNPVLIRKTSGKYNLKTDASKRFENGLADYLTEIGMLATLKLLKEYGGDNVEIDKVIDNFPNQKVAKWKYKVSVSLGEINNLLGTNLKEKEIQNILERFQFNYKYLTTKENLENLIPTVLGAKYKNPSSMRSDAPFAFSCSSLISYLYEGVYMPSISIDKYLYTKNESLSKDNLKFGDLIFINTSEVKKTGIYYESQEYRKGEKVEKGIDHLGMYLGENKILHASSNLENGTEIEDLEKFLTRGELIGYGRVLENLEEKRFVVEIPNERLDLRIKEDLIEEVARVYGLNNIPSILPILKKQNQINQPLAKENLIKSILIKQGFSEIMTYSLRNKGEIKILKSVAQDKNYLRTNLASGMQEAIQKNIFNLPLLNLDEIKMFEIGNCFLLNREGKEQEYRSLCLGIGDGKKNKNYTELRDKIIEEIKNKLKVSEVKFTELKNDKQKDNCFEINLSELFNDSPDLKEGFELNIVDEEIKYKPFAYTPFIVRDIALFVEENISSEEIQKIIEDNITALCISVKLFDEFTKEIDGIKKKSYAFHLIYQDPYRTLTDAEVNLEAEKVYEALKSEGYEIR